MRVTTKSKNIKKTKDVDPIKNLEKRIKDLENRFSLGLDHNWIAEERDLTFGFSKLRERIGHNTVHRSKDGKYTLIDELEDNHLMNIIRLWAKEKQMNLYVYVNEAIRRGLI